MSIAAITRMPSLFCEVVQRKVIPMRSQLPDYLRLHVEGGNTELSVGGCPVPSLDSLRADFYRATGCHLQAVSELEENGDPRSAVACSVASNDSSARFLRRDAAQGASHGPHGQDPRRIGALAEAIAHVLQHLQQTQEALRQREAELAASVPMTFPTRGEPHLADRLEAVLRAAGEALGCQAVAAYLLDEDTRRLKLRVCWGLPATRFLEPPRPLQNAAADLEALVGHTVVIRDSLLASDGEVPEEFRSAVCVPISSPTLPLGTLWAFCQQTRPFSQGETQLLEIVAGRLAAEFEREILLRENLQTRPLQRQLDYAAQWQNGRCPQITPLLHGWQLAAATDQAGPVGGDFHDWFVLPSGQLGIAVGDAQGKLIEASLTAAALHTALRAHANYRHTVSQLLVRVNETLWSASAGDQFASLFYALIDPDSGRLKYAAAGPAEAWVVGEQLRPLNCEEELPLGTQPEAEYRQRVERIEPSEALVVFSEGGLRALKPGQRRDLYRHLRQHYQLTAEELVRRTQAFLAQHTREDRHEDRTLLVAKRRVC